MLQAHCRSTRATCGAQRLRVRSAMILHAHCRSIRTDQALASVCLTGVWRGLAVKMACKRIFLISMVTWMWLFTARH